MPDVTPIYNWPIPEDTDLVKDGAKAIRDLAGAVETTVDSGGDSGLIHIETVTISAGVASVSIENIFDASAYSYFFNVNLLNLSSTSNLRARLLTGSTPDTSANYYVQRNRVNGTSSEFLRETGQTDINYLGRIETNKELAQVFVYFPFETAQTKIMAFGTFGGTTPRWQSAMGGINKVDSFNGIQFSADAGTFTGTIDVFKYRTT